MLKEVHDHLLQIKEHRLAVHQGDHVHAEAFLHLRVLEEVIEHHFRHRALLEIDRNADLTGRLVAHFGNAVEFFVAPEFVHAFVEHALIDHVGNFVNDNTRARMVAAELFEVRACTHDDAAAARTVALVDARQSIDDAAGGKVRRGDQRNEIIDRAVRMLKCMNAGVNGFAQIVRRNIRRHTHCDARRAVHQQFRQTRRQNNRLHFGIVEVRNEVNRVFMQISEHLLGDLHELHFRVAHGRSAVAVDRPEVALTVDERITHREVLRHAHDRLIRRTVAVRMEFTEHFTHHTGSLLRGRTPDVADFLHRVQHAAMNGLQPVTNVRKRTSHDDTHRVVKVGLAHLGFERNREKFVGNRIARRAVAALAAFVIFTLVFGRSIRLGRLGGISLHIRGVCRPTVFCRRSFSLCLPRDLFALSLLFFVH